MPILELLGTGSQEKIRNYRKGFHEKSIAAYNIEDLKKQLVWQEDSGLETLASEKESVSDRLENRSSQKQSFKENHDRDSELEGLYLDWKNETRFESDAGRICTHPAYQRIIGFGRAALPFIFRKLESRPDFWFWALRAITGENPVHPDQSGNLEMMRQAWLDWWKAS